MPAVDAALALAMLTFFQVTPLEVLVRKLMGGVVPEAPLVMVTRLSEYVLPVEAVSPTMVTAAVAWMAMASVYVPAKTVTVGTALAWA